MACDIKSLIEEFN